MTCVGQSTRSRRCRNLFGFTVVGQRRVARLIGREIGIVPKRELSSPLPADERKPELGIGGREVFVPQTYECRQEAQADWFEAVAKLGGEACKLRIFAMRGMASGDAFHQAYTHATQRALLEVHELAFAYFGGLVRTLRYDNIGLLVKKILRGRQRIETDRIVAFRAHWGYWSEYGWKGEPGWFAATI